jgi:hypothetical protein
VHYHTVVLHVFGKIRLFLAVDGSKTGCLKARTILFLFLTAEVHVKPFRFLQQFRGTIDNPT